MKLEPSESNAFAKAVAGKEPVRPSVQRARFALGIALSLVLAACLTLALFLIGGLVVRGVRRGDYLALGAALAVLALTVVMARGRRKPPGGGATGPSRS